MDLYPETELDQGMLESFLTMEEAADYMATHPLNEPENLLSDAEKAKATEEVKKIYGKLKNKK